MLLLSMCVALAALDGSEKLFEAPATFWDHLPIAELRVQGRGKMKFLVDSGSNRSVLFPSSAGGSEVTLSLAASDGKLGQCEFKRVTTGGMTADGERLMSSLGVAGALGDDFLRSHDVFIDYGHKGICFSGDLQPGSPPGGLARLTIEGSLNIITMIVPNRASRHFADLVEQDDRFFVPATVQPDTACLMALDTGTGESAVPHDIASRLKKTGVSKLVAGFQGKTARAFEYLAKIAIGDNPPIPVKVLASDQRGPILGGNAFEGRCLFLQLRNSTASYW